MTISVRSCSRRRSVGGTRGTASRSSHSNLPSLKFFAICIDRLLKALLRHAGSERSQLWDALGRQLAQKWTRTWCYTLRCTGTPFCEGAGSPATAANKEYRAVHVTVAHVVLFMMTSCAAPAVANAFIEVDM